MKTNTVDDVLMYDWDILVAFSPRLLPKHLRVRLYLYCVLTTARSQVLQWNS